MKSYLSIRETAEKWGVSERRINQYCAEERIPGAHRFGKSWAIPADAEKPADPRRQRQRAECASDEMAPGTMPDHTNLMPLMNTAFAPGHCRAAVEAMAAAILGSPFAGEQEITTYIIGDTYFYSVASESVKTPSFKVENGELFVSYDDGGTWTSIGSIDAANGDDGQDGAPGEDGREIELRVDGGYIQWKYNTDPESSWKNLIALSALQGDKGDKGDPGTDGQDGEDGADGQTPYIGDNGNWWIGDTDTGIKAAGSDGENGIGIANIAINKDGELIVTLTDGTEKNLGKVTDNGGDIDNAVTDPTAPTDETYKDSNTPQTDDDSSVILWVALVLVSGTVIAAVAGHGRRRKKEQSREA